MGRAFAHTLRVIFVDVEGLPLAVKFPTDKHARTRYAIFHDASALEGATRKPPRHYYDVVLSKMPPEAASFLQTSVSSVTT